MGPGSFATLPLGGAAPRQRHGRSSEDVNTKPGQSAGCCSAMKDGSAGGDGGHLQCWYARQGAQKLILSIVQPFGAY